MDRTSSSSAPASPYPKSQHLFDADPRLLAKAGSENFPVASRLLPRRYRGHLLAVYSFARLVDDVGDEAAPGEREDLLNEIEVDLGRLDTGVPRLPAVRGLRPTVDACGIPADPFRALIQANRQDQRISRYPGFADLLDYCTLSANPIGHIVLYVFAAATPERFRLADRVCTALQVVEHVQDVVEDLDRGRVYLPQEDLEHFGCSAADLIAPPTDQVRELVAFEVDRAADLLDAGAPLVGTLRGFSRLAVAGYVAGGRSTVAAIRAAGHDVTGVTPRPRVARTVLEWLLAVVKGR